MKFFSSVAVAALLLSGLAFGQANTGYFVAGDDALLLKNPTGIYNVVTITASVPGVYNNFRQLTLPPDSAMFVYSVSSLGVVVNGDTFIQIDSCFNFLLNAYTINSDGALTNAPVTPIGTSQDCPKEGGANGGGSGGGSGSGLGPNSGSGSGTAGSGTSAEGTGGTGTGSGSGSGTEGAGGTGGSTSGTGGDTSGGSTGGGGSSGGSGSGTGSGSGSGSSSGGSGGSGGGSGLPKHCLDRHGKDNVHSETCEQ